MAIEMDALDIDLQIDYAFSLLHSLSTVDFFEAYMTALEEEDFELTEYMLPPNPMLYVMERELFALMAWTLIMTADLENGRFAAPFMNAIHCFEAGKTVCSLERDPRNYFEDDECTVLAPMIVKDIDTVLLCCVENDMHPVMFLKDAVEDLMEFTDLEDVEDVRWFRFAKRFDSFMTETEKNPDAFVSAMEALLEMNDLFFGSEYYDSNSFHIDLLCPECAAGC